jgi:hypothetical protein
MPLLPSLPPDIPPPPRWRTAALALPSVATPWARAAPPPPLATTAAPPVAVAVAVAAAASASAAGPTLATGGGPAASIVARGRDGGVDEQLRVSWRWRRLRHSRGGGNIVHHKGGGVRHRFGCRGEGLKVRGFKNEIGIVKSDEKKRGIDGGEGGAKDIRKRGGGGHVGDQLRRRGHHNHLASLRQKLQQFLCQSGVEPERGGVPYKA